MNKESVCDGKDNRLKVIPMDFLNQRFRGSSSLFPLYFAHLFLSCNGRVE